MSSAGRTEHRDVDARAIVLLGAALAGFILLAIFILGLIYGVPPRPLPGEAASNLPGRDLPVLQTDPHADLEAYTAEKDRALHGYGWVDRTAGIAHVPIEDAMRMIAAGGVPDWGQTPPAAAAGTCALLAGKVPRAPQAANCFPPQAGGKP
jgi:hypothetical protein